MLIYQYSFNLISFFVTPKLQTVFFIIKFLKIVNSLSIQGVQKNLGKTLETYSTQNKKS